MKKVLSIMAAVCMMITMLPVIASNVKAEETEIKWESINTLPTENGSYYLENSVTLTEKWVVSGKNITINLHGRDIESADAVCSLENEANVTFTNSVEGYGSINGQGSMIISVDNTSVLNMKKVRYQPMVASSGSAIYNQGTLNTENFFVYSKGNGTNLGTTIFNMGTWNSLNDTLMHIHTEVGAIVLRNQGEASLTDTSLEAAGGDGNQAYGIYQTGAKAVYLAGNTKIKGNQAAIKATNAESVYATDKDGKIAFTGDKLTVDCNDKYAPYGKAVVLNVTDDTKDKFELVAPESAEFFYKNSKLYLVIKGQEPTEEETTVPDATTSNPAEGETTVPDATTTNPAEEDTTVPSVITNNPTKAVPKTKITNIKAKKSALKVTWKKKKNISGYQIQYGKKKSFKGAKTKTIKGIKTKSYTIKNLAAKKKYFVRIRTFIKDGNKKIFSDWSKAKSKKTK